MAKDKQVKIELIVPKGLKDMLESAAKERCLALDELLIYGAQEYIQNNSADDATDEEFIKSIPF